MSCDLKQVNGTMRYRFLELLGEHFSFENVSEEPRSPWFHYPPPMILFKKEPEDKADLEGRMERKEPDHRWYSWSTGSHGLETHLIAGFPVLWDSKFPYCLSHFELGFLFLIIESKLIDAKRKAGPVRKESWNSCWLGTFLDWVWKSPIMIPVLGFL